MIFIVQDTPAASKHITDIVIAGLKLQNESRLFIIHIQKHCAPTMHNTQMYSFNFLTSGKI